MIEVVDAGPLTLVQDLGRPGFAVVGVPPSGAFDRAAHRLAQRLVGNDEGAAGLECLGGGAALRALAAVVVAVAGADGPLLLDSGGRTREHPRRSPIRLEPGDVLRLGPPTTGLRSYVAVRGGLVVRRELGSASSDLLSRLGPPPVRAGDVVAVGGSAVSLPHVDHAATRPREGALRIIVGPRDDWFDDDALTVLTTTTWTVSPDSNRVGVRLQGQTLQRRDPVRELPSEPMVTGALQVPPDGRPVLLGPDHPTTGGYPVVAVVVADDVDRAAQLRPGDTVTFGRA